MLLFFFKKFVSVVFSLCDCRGASQSSACSRYQWECVLCFQSHWTVYVIEESLLQRVVSFFPICSLFLKNLNGLWCSPFLLTCASLIFLLVHLVSFLQNMWKKKPISSVWFPPRKCMEIYSFFGVSSVWKVDSFFHMWLHDHLFHIACWKFSPIMVVVSSNKQLFLF